MERWYAERAWLGGLKVTESVVIEVRDGLVDEVIPGAEPSEVDHRLDGIVIPGLVSAHSHAFHRALRGRTGEGAGDFWAWRQPMYEVANRLTPDSYRELAVAVFSEMLSAGITTVGEFHYLHHGKDGRPYNDPNAMGRALSDAARQVGIRLTLLDTAYLTSNVSGAPVLPEQRRFSDGTIEAWAQRVRSLARDVENNELLRVGVAAHSVRGVHREDLGAIAQLAREMEAPLHIHVSEQIAENEACFNEHGVTPVQLLAQLDFLGPRVTLIHATHLAPGDIELIASSGTGVCLCPTTEADLGDGIGPAAELALAGVPLSVGSDSNVIIDIIDEARRVEHHDRLRLQRRGIHSPEALLDLATAKGADALGWGGAGRIAKGAPADFIAIDPDSNELAGTDRSTITGIVMSGTRASVTDVVVAGRRVVLSGELVTGPSRAERVSRLESMWSEGQK